MSRLSLAFALTALAVSALPASAQLTISATKAGAYDDFGFNNPASTSYVTGQSFALTRAYFIFELPALDTGVLAASLRLYNPDFGYSSPDATETLTIFHVSTAPVALANGTGDVAAFEDLGDGTAFGSVSVSAADNAGWITISLNASALAALNGAASGSFAFGAALTSLDPTNFFDDELVFGFSDYEATPPELALTLAPPDFTPVPEPSSFAFAGVGLVGLAGLLRRRRRASPVALAGRVAS